MSEQQILLNEDPMNEDPTPTSPGQAKRSLHQVAIVAFLAIFLGFFMQGLILASKLITGNAFPGISFLADLAQGVTWSFFVCTGVAVGLFLSKARAALSGIIAFIFAPAAVSLAKASQKVMLNLLQIADKPGFLSLGTISILRAVEYGLLAWLLAKLIEKNAHQPSLYVGAGLIVGLVFGGAIIALTIQAAAAAGTPQQLSQMMGSLVNEIGSPIGCAVLIYIGQWITGRHQLVVGR
ncbi:hypothetical protein ATN84_20285 [Paramesorhizobium deserti]|uniref:Uncharacterized protein n=1 Tax=Paramesorhizobium deserti TaxID=1494590 RepID=A0A135HPA1_9HYPH|nr:hypothetical protein [Paramesorhizobium deserti]KXF75029.1 hypothetical protein ATN84_20285 [Paramesorhizobium deserti]